jgi:hypothetical protein
VQSKAKQERLQTSLCLAGLIVISTKCTVEMRLMKEKSIAQKQKDFFRIQKENHSNCSLGRKNARYFISCARSWNRQ